jgi:hypothetical protein
MAQKYLSCGEEQIPSLLAMPHNMVQDKPEIDLYNYPSTV